MLDSKKLPDNKFIVELASQSVSGSSDYETLATKIADMVKDDQLTDLFLAPRKFVSDNGKETLEEMEKRGFYSDPKFMLGSALKSSSLICGTYMGAISKAVSSTLIFFMSTIIKKENYEANKQEVIAAIKQELEDSIPEKYKMSDDEIDKAMMHFLED